MSLKILWYNVLIVIILDTYIQDLQQFKFQDNPSLELKHNIGQTISGTVLDKGELTETFYGVINNNYNDIIVNGILTKNNQISNVSGIVLSTLIDNKYLKLELKM